MTACDMYYSALIEYRKFESRDEIKKRCEILLSCANELYESDIIENYEIKIKLFSLFFELFSLRGYVGADIIEEIETINSQLKEDFEAFETNHFEAFKSNLQEIEADANKDKENDDLKSAREKYSTLVEPYRELLEDEQKAQELESKVNELDSEIQRENIMRYIIPIFLILIVIFYLIKKIRRFSFHIEKIIYKLEQKIKKLERIEETIEEIKIKIDKCRGKYEEYYFYAKIFGIFFAAIGAVFTISDRVPQLNFLIPLLNLLGILDIILIILTILFGLLSFSNYISYKSLKERLDAKVQERKNNEKTFKEFFVNLETGDPNFIVVVGDVFEQYIEPIKEFLKLISEEHFNYTEIIPMYLITEHLGKIKTGEREVTHFVEIDERSLELRDNEIKDVHKIGFNLLLIGFINDNALIKDLIDQGLSKIDWLYSDGDFEFIPNAFIKEKDTIICSGKDKDAISNGLRRLLEKLYEEDR